MGSLERPDEAYFNATPPCVNLWHAFVAAVEVQDDEYVCLLLHVFEQSTVSTAAVKDEGVSKRMAQHCVEYIDVTQ